MSDPDSGVEVRQAPSAKPMLERAAAPWLDGARKRLSALHDAGRLPHGILLAGPGGAGQAELGAWLASRILCRGADHKPCGRCPDCRLFLAGSHPDYRWVSVETDKRDISIDQIRSLSESLSMRSYRGGAKAALIAPAEAMTLKAHNALLKTLEEPADETYIVLASSRIDRIPKTILSRCVRIALPLPDAPTALGWLKRRQPAADWAALLELAGGAPFLAIEHADAGLGELDAEMQAAVDAAARGKLDFVATGDSWAKAATAARLAWLESWLTRSLKEACGASDLVNNNRLPWLRPPGTETKIRAGFALLDRIRDARRQAGGSLNMQLLCEGLAVSLADLAGPPADR